MKALITGGNGLLAHSLRQLAPPDFEMVFVDIPDFELTQPDSMQRWLEKVRPQVVINTAAYNLVDRCEQERELSCAVNAEGPKTLAQLCALSGIQLVHYSSDYVFDGAKKAPYVETDPPHPLNHYGAGKLAGERAVLAGASQHLVLRTSWLFGSHPTQTKSFVHTVMKFALAGNPLKATTDQCSVPTYAPDLALWTVELVRRGACGLFHGVNDEGVSRYDWTLAIAAEARRAGLLHNDAKVEPVLSSYFSSTMQRPDYSVMDNRKLTAAVGHPLGSWRQGVRAMLQSWR